MALLLGNIDADTIQIIGKRSSEIFLYYLHVLVLTLMPGYSATTVSAGYYTFIAMATFIPLDFSTPAG